jgi:hypothetical protein
MQTLSYGSKLVFKWVHKLSNSIQKIRYNFHEGQMPSVGLLKGGGGELPFINPLNHNVHSFKLFKHVHLFIINILIYHKH